MDQQGENVNERGWTPSLAAQPFYPSYYPQPYPLPQYFDPNIAHWAYQHMLFNPQQPFPHPLHPQHRPPTDYFPQQQFNPFPTSSRTDTQPQYNGFHPYRRPHRQNDTPPSDWRSPQPPYRHRDASGSSSSVNSASSHSHGSRPRTNSAQSAKSSSNGHSANRNSNGTTVHARTPSSSSSSQRIPHNRNPSSSSSISTASPRTSSPSTSSLPVAAARPVRPSPLSQGTFTAAEKRMSRDDSELDPVPTPAMVRNGGLKGRLRRALSLNSSSVLHEEDGPDDVAITPSTSTPNVAPVDSPVKKRSRAASLFSSRLNASTDNISLSSTVSSASVMIRKLGKLARRNSLAGITSLFNKDKKETDDPDSTQKKGNKRTGKSQASEASVSHVTAELDRISFGADWNASAEMNGLSPAAKLARQHTLKSNAEAAAKAKAQQEASEAAAAAAASASAKGMGGAGTPVAWEKSTVNTRQASPIKRAATRVSEDGTVVLIEDDEDEDSPSDDGSDEHYGRDTDQVQGHSQFRMETWDEDDEEWDGGEDEDMTIRVGLERSDEEDVFTWAVNVRRSTDRTRMPSKGILKDAGTYNQQAYSAELSPRGRANSYTSTTGQSSELGPLARIPSPDPDHIDGLHRHGSHSSSHSHTSVTSGPVPSLPPLSFDSSSDFTLDSPRRLSAELTHNNNHHHNTHPEKSLFNHPTLNSSAPALSTMISAATMTPPSLPHRSATAPAKKLTFANNLSVYDTFSSTIYDRRSEPATWSRLTPALAQQIKEELNSYKMEEMEVHAASRIHTQFFV